ncbi:hypothetical protein CDD83_6670 [Cordyceps sp. RAO-2017]|nr:hypothetical protein CDD83_6670 [Cordyceps sp. RAO-2017]
MATKAKPYALNGGHTAGIFADMSVDGPPIGTLVMIVDRAKNLPNRKTIGKQDPYCAARLGKEAKKTATDIRGGQTPKWDQELRFIVHDSPDYYQLKISVFTDDKKTDLIGDSWIDLRGIIVPGGGQSDMWQGLTCKGKYAGEIRVEITFYDSRPKPDKPVAKRRPQTAASESDSPSPGSAKQRTPMKRRPLPSDPVTGEAPSPPPLPAPQSAERPAAEPLHHQTPPRPHAFVPTQSPLQAVEYSTPSPQGARQQPEPYLQSSPSGYSTARVDGPRPVQRSRETPEHSPRHRDDGPGHAQNASASPYDQPAPRGQQSPLPEHHHEMPAGEAPGPSQPFEDECPPPPPAHRSVPNSDSQELVHRGAHDISPQRTTPSTLMRHEVLKNEAHRHSAPAYPGRPTFRPYDPTSSTPNTPDQPLGHASFDPSPPPLRYHSYDQPNDPQHRSMQATVEDAPESPPSGLHGPHRHSGLRLNSPDEMMFQAAPRAETIDVTRRPGTSSRYASQSPSHNPAPSQDMVALPASTPPLHTRDQPNSLVYQPVKGQGHRSGPRYEYEPSHARNYAEHAMPEVPLSLSPGMDPALSLEISEQIYEERRHDARYAAPPAAAPTRARHPGEGGQYTYSSYAAGYVPHAYDGRSQVTYSSAGPEKQLVRRGHVSPSPSPQHTIPRKSVSPGPPLAEDRLISDVPFSPDAYDALNPAVASPQDPRQRGERIDPDAKIITHDGREIDPSDHLPMESWAPEPEPKSAQRAPSPEPRARRSPLGAQPMPPSGRRPLRIAGAQPSVAQPRALGGIDGPHTPPTPGSGGRGRLQKRANRGGGPGPTTAGSSPLAPVSTDNFQERASPYTPTRGPRRWGSWEYANENRAPQQGAAPPIPAKIPLPVMSGANGPGDLAMWKEMQRIDIGAGRSRRRGGY